MHRQGEVHPHREALVAQIVRLGETGGKLLRRGDAHDDSVSVASLGARPPCERSGQNGQVAVAGMAKWP